MKRLFQHQFNTQIENSWKLAKFNDYQVIADKTINRVCLNEAFSYKIYHSEFFSKNVSCCNIDNVAEFQSFTLTSDLLYILNSSCRFEVIDFHNKYLHDGARMSYRGNVFLCDKSHVYGHVKPIDVLTVDNILCDYVYCGSVDGTCRVFKVSNEYGKGMTSALVSQQCIKIQPNKHVNRIEILESNNGDDRLLAIYQQNVIQLAQIKLESYSNEYIHPIFIKTFDDTAIDCYLTQDQSIVMLFDQEIVCKNIDNDRVVQHTKLDKQLMMRKFIFTEYGPVILLKNNSLMFLTEHGKVKNTLTLKKYVEENENIINVNVQHSHILIYLNKATIVLYTDDSFSETVAAIKFLIKHVSNVTVVADEAAEPEAYGELMRKTAAGDYIIVEKKRKKAAD